MMKFSITSLGPEYVDNYDLSPVVPLFKEKKNNDINVIIITMTLIFGCTIFAHVASIPIQIMHSEEDSIDCIRISNSIGYDHLSLEYYIYISSQD